MTEIARWIFPLSSEELVASLFSMSQNSISFFKFSTGSIFWSVPVMCVIYHTGFMESASLCISELLLMMVMKDKSEPLPCTWLSVSSCEVLQMNSPLGTSQAARNHLGIHPLTQSIISIASPTIRNRYPFATSTARCTNRESPREASKK